MNKIILAHDHKFKLHNGIYYSGASLSYSLLEIYRDFGDELVVISRVEKVNLVDEKVNRSSGVGVSFCTLPNMRSLKGLFDVWGNFKKIKLATSDASLIIVKLPSFIGLLTFLANINKREKIVVEVIGNAFEANFLHGSILGKVFALFEHYLTRFSIRFSSNVIYITSNYLQKIYPNNKNTVVCSNAIVQPVIESTLIKRYGNKRSRIIKIGLIGSLDVEYKGHDTAIKVISSLQKKDPSVVWELYFVGGGDNARWLKLSSDLSVENNVIFKGAVRSGEGIFSFIDSMDFMLQPSTVEAQGRCIIEAMSRGCPVLGSKIGGIPELLDSTMIFDKFDYTSMAEKILLLTNNSDLYQNSSRVQWEASKEFSYSTVENKRRKFIQEVLNK